MREKNRLVQATTIGIALAIGVGIGYLLHSPASLISALKAQNFLKGSDAIESRLPDVVQTYKAFPDSVSEPLRLHVFHPSDAADKVAASIMFFHGGGWTRGDATLFYPQCTYLAARGIGCISAEYRTSETHDTSPLHAVEDAKDAYTYVATSAQQLGLPSTPWYVAGASAGAHLAASIVTADYPEYNMRRAYPHGVILLGPVIDNSESGYGFERIKHFGNRFSPLHNLDERFPRTLLIVGDTDRFVPLHTAAEFVGKLDELGVDATLKIYSDSYHSFYLDDRFQDTMDDIELFVTTNVVTP